MSVLAAALIAILQPVAMIPTDCADRKLFSGTRIELAKGDVCLMTYPESATRFRNIRSSGESVCGEVSVPNISADHLLPFALFAWHDRRNWAIPSLGSYTINRDGLLTSEVELQADLHEASTKGAKLLVVDAKAKLADFHAALDELLAPCRNS